MLRKTYKILALIPTVFILFSLTLEAFATNYYVNGSAGSDSYNGLYETYQGGSNGPWKTLGKANTSVTNPSSGGHIINVAAGTYAERVSESHSGTSSSNMIWWMANGAVYMQGFYITGNYVKVTGFDIETNVAGYDGGGFYLTNGNTGCLIDNNNIHDCTHRGIFLYGSSNNTVSNNTIARVAETAIWITGDNNLIENNDISDIRNTIKGQTPTADQADGIRFAKGALPGYTGSGTIIRGNYIHGITYANQNYSGEPPHIDAFQGGTQNTIIERNHIVMLENSVHANTSMHGFMMENDSNITIRNNIFEVTSFINTGDPGSPNSNLYIYNNTIRSHYNFWSGPYPVYGINLQYISGTVHIENNILIDFGTTESGGGNSQGHVWKAGSPSITLTEKNNVVWNSNGKAPLYQGVTHDASDLWGTNPMFVSQWSNLQLQSSSPCIDAGITIGSVTNDYDRISRPQGSYYDIGAHEYTTSTASPEPPTGLRVI